MGVILVTKYLLCEDIIKSWNSLSQSCNSVLREKVNISLQLVTSWTVSIRMTRRSDSPAQKSICSCILSLNFSPLYSLISVWPSRSKLIQQKFGFDARSEPVELNFLLCHWLDKSRNGLYQFEISLASMNVIVFISAAEHIIFWLSEILLQLSVYCECWFQWSVYKTLQNKSHAIKCLLNQSLHCKEKNYSKCFCSTKISASLRCFCLPRSCVVRPQN